MTMDEFQLYHEQTFDSFSKRVIKNIAIDILREEARLAKRETSLSALSARTPPDCPPRITYELDEEVSMSLDLHGYPIQVHDPILGRALLALPPKRRDVVLLFYFADRNEPQIGRLLHLSTSAVSFAAKRRCPPCGSCWSGNMERNGRIAYETIRAAKRGDPEAVQEILRHYERYILRFCGRTVYDEEGVPHKVIDENRRKQIEAEYVAALILRYDADRRPGEAPEGA